MYTVGRNDSGQLGLEHPYHEFTPRPVPSLSTKQVVQTACGLHHSVFVTLSGEVYSCGFNDNGQLGHNDTKSKNVATLIEGVRGKTMVQVACGYYHTLIRRDSGEVYSFGRNDKGQLGFDTSGHACIFPRLIGEFHVGSSGSGGLMSSVDLGGIVNSSISSSFSNNNEENSSGESFFSRAASGGVSTGTEQVCSRKVIATKIACGCYHSIILSEAGQIFTFGRGNHGQLGHGGCSDSKFPKLVSFFADKSVTEISGGFYHTIVLVKSKLAQGSS